MPGEGEEEESKGWGRKYFYIFNFLSSLHLPPSSKSSCLDDDTGPEPDGAMYV